MNTYNPAFPTPSNNGLTKREFMALHILTALIAKHEKPNSDSDWYNIDFEFLSNISVIAAETLAKRF
jgi:hypothetical protein